MQRNARYMEHTIHNLYNTLQSFRLVPALYLEDFQDMRYN